MKIDDVYTEIIMEHNRSKHNKKILDNPDGFARGHNPNCGDDLTVFVKLNENIIEDISYNGSGCAISEASASIMIDLLKGKTVKEARICIETFVKMIKKEVDMEFAQNLLEDASCLAGVSNMPARVKCAVLAWHALDNAMG